MMTRARRPEAGMTLMEIMIAIAIMAFMMALVWSTTTHTTNTKRDYESMEERMHEIRNGLARVVDDLQEAYISKNQDIAAFEPRTAFIGKDGGDVDELRFSSLAHQQLYADADESDETMISYSGQPHHKLDDSDPESSSSIDWIRRETRRLADPGTSYKDTPAAVDVVIPDVKHVDFEYWDWKDNEWKADWDTSKADAQKDRLPTRVRITVTYDDDGYEQKISTQAQLLLQEPVESRLNVLVSN